MPLSPGHTIRSSFFSTSSPQPNLVLLLLNYTLPKSAPLFWQRAQVRICADGGANRLYDCAPHWVGSKDPDAARRQFLPDVIKGDLDSIRPDVATFYTKLGIKILDLSADQDTTDLDKCLHCAECRLAKEGVPLSEATILALGALGGRLDHALSNINSLYTHQQLQIVLCGDGSLARLIPKGCAIIQPHRAFEGPMCGLLALGSPATASSTGLKWNLQNHNLAVGGLMSTSNALVEDEVILHSDQPLLWTTEFRDSAIE